MRRHGTQALTFAMMACTGLLGAVCIAHEPPPDCECPEPASLYAYYVRTNGSLLGEFVGPDLGVDHLCLRWVDNDPVGYNFIYVATESVAGDSDLCGDEEGLEGIDYASWDGHLEWRWSGAPGYPIANEDGEARQFAVVVPIAEVQTYDLQVEVIDLGGVCTPYDGLPQRTSPTDVVKLDIWAPIRQITWEYLTTIPTPFVQYGGKNFNGGVKTRVISTTRIEKHTTPQLSPSICRIGGVQGTGSDVWRLSPTFYVGPTIQYASLTVIAVICPSWGVNAAPGAVTCSLTANPEMCVSYGRTNPDEIWNFVAVDAGNPCLASPNINGELAVRLRAYVNCAARSLIYEYMVDIDHDGFPQHDVIVDGTARYLHNPCATGETPASLFPPMEHTFTSPWKLLRSVPF